MSACPARAATLRPAAVLPAQGVAVLRANNRGHDWSVAVDGAGRPFYAWVGEARAEVAAQGDFLEAAAPLIRQVRALEVQRAERRYRRTA